MGKHPGNCVHIRQLNFSSPLFIYVPGRKGTLDLKLHWYPKFYNCVILYVSLDTMGTSTEFLLVGLKLVVFKLFDQ